MSILFFVFSKKMHKKNCRKNGSFAVKIDVKNYSSSANFLASSTIFGMEVAGTSS